MENKVQIPLNRLKNNIQHGQKLFPLTKLSILIALQ